MNQTVPIFPDATFPVLPRQHRLSLVREATASYDSPNLGTPDAVARLVHPFLADVPVEHFIVLCLNTKYRLIGAVNVSVGDVQGTIVHPREVFSPAILLGATTIIAVHNHPSGDPTPSMRDVEVTSRLRAAGELLGIQLIDHVVVTADVSRFYSFQLNGFLPRT